MTIPLINVRPLNLNQDLLKLTELTKQLGYPMDVQHFKKRLELIHLDPKYITLIAEYNQKIVGYVGLIEQFTWQFDEKVLIIQAFVIDENFRGLGLAKQFLQVIEAFALQKNIKSINLNSGNRPERIVARGFYKKQGFNIDSLGFKKILASD